MVRIEPDDLIKVVEGVVALSFVPPSHAAVHVTSPKERGEEERIRSEADSLVEVLNGAVIVPLVPPCTTTILIGVRITGIESDGFVEILDGLIVVPDFQPGLAAIPIDGCI